jgi:hypothetical protein
MLPENDPDMGESDVRNDALHVHCVHFDFAHVFDLMPRCGLEQPCSEIPFIGKVRGCTNTVRNVPGVSSSHAT